MSDLWQWLLVRNIPTVAIRCICTTSALYPWLCLLYTFLHIVPTVELASFSASTHCLEGFAHLCIITPSPFLPQSLSIPEKHTNADIRASKGSLDTFILLKYWVFQWPEWAGQCDGCCRISTMSLELSGWRWSSVDFICYYCEIQTAALRHYKLNVWS